MNQTQTTARPLAADEAALDDIAARIAPEFGVSAEMIARRLRENDLCPES